MASPHIRYVVLDILKPRNPSLPEFAIYLGELTGITKVDVTMIEMDDRTESLKVVIEGTGIKFDELKEHIEKQSATIHSIDQIIVEKPPKH